MKLYIFLLAAASAVDAASAPMPAPPGIPSQSIAQTELSSLAVKAFVDPGGYNRDLFPHWSTQSGACNIREYVLKRDGTNVVTNSACATTSGTWVSPYDGESWKAVSDVDIDHMVPLKNAWANGASRWTTAKREQFANDILSPQLWTVTDNLNQAKGDKSPDAWKPPLTSFYCTYAKSWVQVKYKWELSITSAEKSALASMINTSTLQYIPAS
ncbi:hypothetical protein B0T25DRAFT_619637 [Lasiosphaeria hispida]|uniref:GmrSD restriction endonucleases C-terminal domain-containing protein n=1 Tax=Lasiosphaeria hispida TaxID=260671 RepID=A0AAJ0HTW3_9PEZI|nr:hypothetical protein B0T25DRAFT_619637 [Lasiosphaeria hispida]